MAKVLITAIGTGRLIQGDQGTGLLDSKPSRQYSKATYLIDGSEYSTEFIAEALIRHYRIDRVFMVGTAKSMWEQVYYTFSGDNRDDDYYLELAQAIDDSNHARYQYNQSFLKKVEMAIDQGLGKRGSRCFLIRYGLDDDELLLNFNTFLEMADLLEDGDEVYVDVTHSFRSLALFQFMMTSFIENLPGRIINIEKILYGMLDISREMGGKAKVVDLSVINELNQWIKGIHELESDGNGYLVADLLERYPEQRKVGLSIRDLTNRININYLRDIRNELGKANWSHLGKIEGPGAFATGSIRKFLKKFSGNEPESFFELKVARWHFEKKRYAEGYITLVEAIVTRLCEVTGYDKDDQKMRGYAKERLLKGQDAYLHGLGTLLKKVNCIRRDIAHFQGGSESEYRDAVENCLKYCSDAERMFKEVGREFLK